MSAITYTAKRSLISGHSAESSYSMDIDMEQIGIQDLSINDSEHIALNGSTEGIFYGAVVEYQLTTVPLGEDDNGDFDKMREFITSVFGSASFTFDAYGTVASPLNAQTCVLVPGSHSYNRIAPTKLTSAPTFTVSFKIRTLP